jgi:hypothetical protein
MRFFRRSFPSGFSALELLGAAIAVSVLVSIALPRLQGLRENSYIAAMKSDLSNMPAVQAVFRTQVGRFAHVDELLDQGALVLSAGVQTVGSVAFHDGWFVRVRHQKTNVFCEIYYSESDTSAPNRITCDNDEPATGGNDGDESQRDNPTGDLDFVWTPEPPTEQCAVRFFPRGSVPVELLWDFGGGSTSPLRQPTHTFGGSGSFSVTLRAGSGPFLRSVTKEVMVKSQPYAFFSWSPQVPRQGDLVDFDASDSYDPDGDPLSFVWDMGDGSAARMGMNVSHTYATWGTYTVTLTAAEGQCSRSTYSDVITVLPIIRSPDLIPPPDQQTYAGVTQAVDFVLRNNSTIARTFSFAASSANTAAVLSPANPASIAVGPGAAVPVSLTYTVPANAIGGAASLVTLVATDTEDWSRNASASFTVTAMVAGCTDPVARNYNSIANVDDGSCWYNGPPTASITCPSRAAINESFSCSAAGTDPDADTLTPVWEDNSGGWTKTFSYSTPAEYTQCVRVQDGFGGVSEWACAQTRVEVYGCMQSTARNYNPNATYEPEGTCVANQAPTAFITCPTEAFVNDPVTCTASGTDPEGDELTPSWGSWSYTATYPSSGTQTVCVSVTDSFGAQSPLTCAQINILPRIMGCTDPGARNYSASATHDDGSCAYNRDPVATIACPATAGVNQTFTCTAGGSDPDGDPLTTNWPGWSRTYSYANTGTYQICVTVYDGQGGSATACTNITIGVLGCTNPAAANYSPSATLDDGSCLTNQPPSITLTCPDESPPNTSFTCSVSGSDPDGDPITYTWAAGGTGSSRSFSFPTTGVQTICVTASDGQGGNTEACRNVNIVVYGCTNPSSPNYNPSANVDNGSCTVNSPPAASITCPAQAGTNTTFTCYAGGTDPDGDQLGFTWAAGGTGPTRNFSYPTVGNQTICVTAADGRDGTNEACTTVYIGILGCTDPAATNYNSSATINDGSCTTNTNRSPTLNISCPSNAARNATFTCTASGNDPDGDPISYSWTGGGSGTSRSYSFSTTGTQTICVTGSDGRGGSNTSCTTVTIVVYGCTDPSASNYNSSATVDDGLCTYAEDSNVGVSLDCPASVPASSTFTCTAVATANSGWTLSSSWGTPAWSRSFTAPASGSISHSITAYASKSGQSTQSASASRTVQVQVVLGCMQSTAGNYNPAATQENGTCEWAVTATISCPEQVTLNMGETGMYTCSLSGSTTAPSPRSLWNDKGMETLPVYLDATFEGNVVRCVVYYASKSYSGYTWSGQSAQSCATTRVLRNNPDPTLQITVACSPGSATVAPGGVISMFCTAGSTMENGYFDLWSPVQTGNVVMGSYASWTGGFSWGMTAGAPGAGVDVIAIVKSNWPPLRTVQRSASAWTTITESAPPPSYTVELRRKVYTCDYGSPADFIEIKSRWAGYYRVWSTGTRDGPYQDYPNPGAPLNSGLYLFDYWENSVTRTYGVCDAYYINPASDPYWAP